LRAKKSKHYARKQKRRHELIRELSSFGKELLVLSPTDIRKRVRDRLTALLQAYQVL